MIFQLQWGRRNYPAETFHPQVAEYPRAAWLQWGRRNYPAETRQRRRNQVRRRHRFNGAAGITRRKLHRAPAGTRNEFGASMGPPELPGGNLNVAFGADLMKRMLQWGRRNYPAETWNLRVKHRDRIVALQWGRRNYPAETKCAVKEGCASRSCFNGAAGITRRKP